MNQRLERVAGCHPLLRRPVLALIEQCEQKLNKRLMVVYWISAAGITVAVLWSTR